MYLYYSMSSRNQAYQRAGWLTGRSPPYPASGLTRLTSTTQVTHHAERWDLGRCSAPAQLAYTARRIAWSAAQAARDAGGLFGERGAPGGRNDLQQQGIYADPADPTKMFQQDDNTFRDAVTFATILAILWVFASAYTQLEKLP